MNQKYVPTLVITIDGYSSDYLKDSIWLRKFSYAFGYADLIPIYGYQPEFASFFSGAYPGEIGIGPMFCYNPDNSIYKWTRRLKPILLVSDKIVILRNWIRKFIAATSLLKSKVNFLQHIHEIPYNVLNLFDLTVRKDVALKSFIPGYKTLFDFLRENNILFKKIHGNIIIDNYRIKRPILPLVKVDDDTTFKYFKKNINKEYTFYHLYLSDIDKIGHKFGPDSFEIKQAIKSLDLKLEKIISLFKEKFQENHIVIFSDHGMVKTNKTVDVNSVLDKLPLKQGRDYLVFLDSTFARFWFFNSKSKDIIVKELNKVPNLKLLSQDILNKYHINYQKEKYGECIFASNYGCLILPNYFQKKMNLGMHGFLPEDPGMQGIYTANRKINNKTISYIDVLPSILTGSNLSVPRSCSGKSIV